MNRKEFNLIAETIRNLPKFSAHLHGAISKQTDVVHIDTLVNRFADALATTNPRFKRERFIQACNGRDGK